MQHPPHHHHHHVAVLMTEDEPFFVLWQVFLHEEMIYVLAESTNP